MAIDYVITQSRESKTFLREAWSSWSVNATAISNALTCGPAAERVQSERQPIWANTTATRSACPAAARHGRIRSSCFDGTLRSSLADRSIQKTRNYSSRRYSGPCHSVSCTGIIRLRQSRLLRQAANDPSAPDPLSSIRRNASKGRPLRSMAAMPIPRPISLKAAPPDFDHTDRDWALRQIFHKCYRRYRDCCSDFGPSYRKVEYAADFCLIAKRALGAGSLQHRIFHYHFLRGADWRISTTTLDITRAQFFIEVYRIEQKLGAAFLAIKPYPLFPPDQYLAGRSARTAA